MTNVERSRQWKVKVSKDFTIHLPEEMKKIISQRDEFMFAVIGDSIRLQRIRNPDICALAASIEDKEAPSIEEISNIVHRLRGTGETKSSN
jgi:hypothetical protein